MKILEEPSGNLNASDNKDRPSRNLDRFKGHSFYKNLVEYLAPAYPKASAVKMNKLAQCSYAYFTFVLIGDQLMDEKNDSTSQSGALNFLNSINTFEHTIKNLAFLFPEESLFWEKFESHKKQYHKAIIVEKALNANIDGFSLEQFISLAVGKSALCFAIIDALGILNGDNEHGADISACLKHFHIAFQYRDDVDDFKQDLSNGQYSYLHHLLNLELRELSIHESELPADLKYKYVFLTGLAVKSMENAISHYSLARTYINNLLLTELTEYIDYQIEDCQKRIFEIDSIIIKTKSKASKSFTLIFPEKVLSCETLRESFNYSIQYLRESLTDRGFWEDFLTGKGISNFWITSYAGRLLAEVADMETELTAKATLNRINIQGLKGSYNESMISDGDSLNFLVGFLNKLDQRNQPLVTEWLAFMNDNGGWLTYNNESTLRNALRGRETNVRGWMLPKSCVTAASCYFLSEMPAYKQQYYQTADYLVKQQAPEGYWESYWWTDNVYATSWAIAGLTGIQQYRSHCLKAITWLLGRQQKDGSWLNSGVGECSAFYSALAIRALLTFDKKNYNEEIMRGFQWIINNQMTDGSWCSSPILRIPATDVDSPKEVKNWKKGNYGPNILVEDYNRIMSTSTIMNTIGLCLA